MNRFDELYGVAVVHAEQAALWLGENLRNRAYLPYDPALGIPTLVPTKTESRCTYCHTKHTGQAHCDSCGAPQ
jgi:hypothetical protein